ncbi:hypothetical protein C8J56DRAFT_1158910 [Mycena floridula]|nr:hypothetical protein C8J56DRAFT_1158910 [Mycena floridula]
MFYRSILFTTLAVCALLSGAAPGNDLQERQIGSVLDSLTSVVGGGATSVIGAITSVGGGAGGAATSVIGSVAGDVTQVADGVFKSVVNAGGTAFTVVTSEGGAVITLATGAAGHLTTFAGAQWTALGDAVNNSASSTSAHTSSICIGLLTVVASSLIGAMLTF